MKNLIALLGILFFVIGCSCSDEKPNFTKEEILAKLREGAPDLELILPPSISVQLVDCYQFLPPCKNGHIVKIKDMEVTGLYYEDQKKAYKSARAIRGYHLRNWAFDQVSGEPILERFFENHMGAKKVE